MALRRAYHPDLCLCSPDLGYICRNCSPEATSPPPPETIEESDSFTPDHRRTNPLLPGCGHRLADQDGGTGEEWVSPEEDNEGQLLEAARILLDAEEI